jgi:hypothetical protein
VVATRVRHRLVHRRGRFLVGHTVINVLSMFAVITIVCVVVKEITK